FCGTGLSAAIQANELGMKTVVLEKEEELGGNTNRASSGMNAAETNVQLQHGVIDNVADFYHETYQDGGRLNDKDMLGYFVYHTAPAIDWLADHGIKLDDITITGGMSRKRTHRPASMARSEEHTSELQSRFDLVCRLLLEKKNHYFRFFPS